MEESRASVAVLERGDAGALPGDGALQRSEAKVRDLEALSQPILLRSESSILLGLVKARYELTRNGQLVANTACLLGTPACEPARRGLEAQHQSMEGVRVMDRAPSCSHRVVEPIKPQPEVLKMKTSMRREHGGAVQQQGGVVRDDRRKAAKVTFAVSILPVRGAEHTIQVHKSGRGLLVRPREATPVEVDLLKRKVIDEATESAHHTTI